MGSDFERGAVFALACVTMGVFITLIFMAVIGEMRHRRGDGDGGIDVIDPTVPPVDDWREGLDGPAQEWIDKNTLTPFVEANLIAERGQAIRDWQREHGSGQWGVTHFGESDDA